jgi:hypothetical protein
MSEENYDSLCDHETRIKELEKEILSLRSQFKGHIANSRKHN